MAAPLIEIDTATLAKPVGRSAHIRIGGTVFEARCPKDAVLFRVAEEADKTLASVMRILAGMLGTESCNLVAEMLDDPDNDEVSIETLSGIINYLLRDPNGPQWEKDVVDSLKALGSGEPPRTVPVKKAASRTPTARKTPVRRR